MHARELTASKKSVYVVLCCLTFCLLFFVLQKLPAMGADEDPSSVKQQAATPNVLGPVDEYGRGVPRSSFEGLVSAADEKDFTRAAEYLDLRNLPREVRSYSGAELVEMLRDILNRALWVDIDMLSDHPKGFADDGLPSYRDLLGQIKVGQKTYNLLMQKVPRGDGVFIWKISNRTVAEIPKLHELLGNGPFGDALAAVLPDIEIFGTKLWQWVGVVIILIGAYLAAFILTAIAALIVRHSASPQKTEKINLFIKGPLRFLVWIMLSWSLEDLVNPTVTMKMLMKGGTLILIAFAWTLIWLFDFYIDFLRKKFEDRDRTGAIVLLNPVRTVVRITIVTIAFLVWLDNIGFQVTTLLAGLGVGGIAIALAAQAILADFIAAIIIVTSQPVRVGDFCHFGNTWGVVEDIGLRATRIRTLDNTMVSVPNAEFSKQHIENYTLREKVWFHPKISLPYETSKEQIKEIVGGIEEMLKNHPEVLDEPVQVFFTQIGSYSHNIDVFSYVGTGDYGRYKKIAEELNLGIMDIVEKAGARLALPSRKVYMVEGRPDEGENDAK